MVEPIDRLPARGFGDRVALALVVDIMVAPHQAVEEEDTPLADGRARGVAFPRPFRKEADARTGAAFERLFDLDVGEPVPRDVDDARHPANDDEVGALHPIHKGDHRDLEEGEGGHHALMTPHAPRGVRTYRALPK